DRGMELAVGEREAAYADLLEVTLQVHRADGGPAGEAREAAAGDEPEQRRRPEGEERLAHGRRVQRQPGRVGEQRPRFGFGLLLDVRDVQTVDDTEARGRVERDREILDDERRAGTQGRRLRLAGQAAERGPG